MICFDLRVRTTLFICGLLLTSACDNSGASGPPPETPIVLSNGSIQQAVTAATVRGASGNIDMYVIALDAQTTCGSTAPAITEGELQLNILLPKTTQPGTYQVNGTSDIRVSVEEYTTIDGIPTAKGTALDGTLVVDSVGSSYVVRVRASANGHEAVGRFEATLCP